MGSPPQVAGTRYLWNVTEENPEDASKFEFTLAVER